MLNYEMSYKKLKLLRIHFHRFESYNINIVTFISNLLMIWWWWLWFELYKTSLISLIVVVVEMNKKIRKHSHYILLRYIVMQLFKGFVYRNTLVQNQPGNCILEDRPPSDSFLHQENVFVGWYFSWRTVPFSMLWLYQIERDFISKIFQQREWISWDSNSYPQHMLISRAWALLGYKLNWMMS